MSDKMPSGFFKKIWYFLSFSWMPGPGTDPMSYLFELQMKNLKELQANRPLSKVERLREAIGKDVLIVCTDRKFRGELVSASSVQIELSMNTKGQPGLWIIPTEDIALWGINRESEIDSILRELNE